VDSNAEADAQTSGISRYWRSHCNHYAAISTDPCYTSPHRKDPANLVESEYISEWQIFQILDHLRPTATVLMAFQPGSSVWAPQSFSNLCLPFKSLACHIIHLAAVEASWHHTHTQVSSTETACRFPAHLHHTNPHQNYGENWSSQIPLSNSLTLSFNSIFLRPTCIPSYRLSMYGNYFPTQHHHKHAPLQSFS